MSLRTQSRSGKKHSNTECFLYSKCIPILSRL
nr:MAG TPA: hypothetical protein [Microviridae sp.]DAY17740.1 MAG TPA: hypothetical protein [Microviridae sp.]